MNDFIGFCIPYTVLNNYNIYYIIIIIIPMLQGELKKEEFEMDMFYKSLKVFVHVPYVLLFIK